MEISHLLAGIFGPFFVIVSIWCLSYDKQVKKVLDSLKHAPALLLMGGNINLLMGLVIVNLYSVWDLSLSVLVSLLGWVLIVRGLLLLFFPEGMLKLRKTTNWRFFFSFVSIVWGLGLCYYAFIQI